MVNKIDHVGIAVKSIDKACAFYEKVLGLQCKGIAEVESQKVRIAFFEIGEIHIELLEPTGEDSPIARFLEKQGEGFHHIAYQTDDIESRLEAARDNDVQVVHETPVEGAGGKLVSFLHPKSTFGVLTEFCSKPDHLRTDTT